MPTVSVAPDGPLHRLAQRGDRSLGLAHQHIGAVTQLTALLHELPGGVTCLLRPEP